MPYYFSRMIERRQEEGRVAAIMARASLAPRIAYAREAWASFAPALHRGDYPECRGDCPACEAMRAAIMEGGEE